MFRNLLTAGEPKHRCQHSSRPASQSFFHLSRSPTSEPGLFHSPHPCVANAFSAAGRCFCLALDWHHGASARRHEGARPLAGPGWSLRDDGAWRPWRRRDQGGASRAWRRYSPLGTAFCGGGRGSGVGLLSGRQPQQAFYRGRSQGSGGAGAGQEACGGGRCRDRELEARGPGEARPGLRGAARNEPRPRLLFHYRVWFRA